LRKQNYRQQKKQREDARKVRQAKKQERRLLPTKEPGEGDDAQSAPGDAADDTQSAPDGDTQSASGEVPATN
jgi:hypothetical protein